MLFLFGTKTMGDNYEKVWVDIPTPYKDRKSSSGLSFGGKYVIKKKTNKSESKKEKR